MSCFPPHPELTVLVECDQADPNENLSCSRCKTGVVQVLRPATQFITHLSTPCQIIEWGERRHMGWSEDAVMREEYAVRKVWTLGPCGPMAGMLTIRPRKKARSNDNMPTRTRVCGFRVKHGKLGQYASFGGAFCP